MKDIYGGAYLASCIYAPEEFIKKNPNTTQAVVNAMVKALKWLAKATPEQVMAVVPEAYMAGEPLALQGGAVEEHDRLFAGRANEHAGRAERLQGGQTVRTLRDRGGRLDQLAATFDNSFCEEGGGEDQDRKRGKTQGMVRRSICWGAMKCHGPHCGTRQRLDFPSS